MINYKHLVAKLDIILKKHDDYYDIKSSLIDKTILNLLNSFILIINYIIIKYEEDFYLSISCYISNPIYNSYSSQS